MINYKHEMFTVLQNPLVTYFSRITLLTLTVHGHVSFFGVNRESYFVFKKNLVTPVPVIELFFEKSEREWLYALFEKKKS